MDSDNALADMITKVIKLYPLSFGIEHLYLLLALIGGDVDD